jgi:hypothetical protein
MALVLDVAYDDLAGLRHDFESQLALGGLFVDGVDASLLPPLATLTLRLCAGAGAPLCAPARLTVATAQAACVEIAAEARADFAAAVAARTSGVAARAGARRARLCELAALDAPVTDKPIHDANAQKNDADAPQNTSAPESASAPAQASAADHATRGAPHVEDGRGQIPLERRITLMSAAEKVQLALHGNREARQLLMRDRAGVVQSSLVRNPRLSLDEAQALARAPQLSAEAAEVLAQHPSWGTSSQVALALVRNPRTPLPTATQLLSRLLPADLRMVAKGVGVRTPVAAAARKRLLDDDGR